MDTYPSPDLLPLSPSNPSRSSHSTELSNLCFRADSHQLSILHVVVYLWGFPGSSAGKESACNARDPGLILGLGKSPGEGIGYPLQYSWVFLVAQRVKNPPAMWQTWLQSLEVGMAIHSIFSCLENPHGQRNPVD